MRERTRRHLTALVVVGAVLVVPQAARANIDSALGVPCVTQSDGSRLCGSSAPRSTSKAFDGVPLDVNIAFPPARAGRVDGRYPLIMLFHGYGGEKIGFGGMQHWLDRGYAVFSMTDRGFHESCGSVASRTAAGSACDKGYVRLIDNRYEVRDAQEFAGRLADQGVIAPRRIGAIGGSYGGGMSMALAALRDRKVLTNYKLVPWRSPQGRPMEIAAAAPNIPWTDLGYSLVPNGSTLDYVADAPYRGRIGVGKQSLTNGLYVSGQGAPGYYAPPGTDPTADLTRWRELINAGEPYGSDARAAIGELSRHHSSYAIDHSRKPAPLLMSSGFTDDLFPVDETIRFYNRTRTQYPGANLALFFGDFGHPRAANKPDASSALNAQQDSWMDYFVKGSGPQPRGGVTAYTQTCPSTAPSVGPYRARSWARIAPGEIRFRARRAITISPTAGSEAIAKPFNPVGGGGACATAPATDQPGSASYRLDAAPARGYTLLGSPTVVARFKLGSATSQVAARLLDVAPDGTETLVARGLWRPSTGPASRQVFQLHANGWKFAAGHVPKLELLPADYDKGFIGGYGRFSNGQGPVTVSKLDLRLPVVERPGSRRGLVQWPARKEVPFGYRLAADFRHR